MKQRNFIRAILYLLVCITLQFSNVFAQQSRVDSVIQLLNTSVINGKLDSARFGSAIQLLRTTTLSESQVLQMETVAQQFKKYEKDNWPYAINLGIFGALVNSDVQRAITYSKRQIEKFDSLKSPEASEVVRSFLSGLRFPFRNTNRLEEGFQYFTQKLNDYKNRNDSLCISECYFVLGGFYRVSGIIDLAIYNMKKSCSYLDTLKDKEKWINNMGVIGYYYLLKDNKNECLNYSGITFRYRLQNQVGYSFSALNMAKMFLVRNETDSAAYYLEKAKEDTLTPNGNETLCVILQVEALYKIELGALDEAEALLIKCRQLIAENNIAVNPGAGIVAPDYYMALVRIKQNRINDAIALLKSDIKRLENNRLDILRDYKLMAELYKRTGSHEKAAETYEIFIAKQESLLTDQDNYRSINFEAEQQMNEKERSIAILESQNKIAALSRNFFIGIAASLVLLAAGLYNRFRYKRKANVVLEETLSNLKSTQSQLIQTEKMASLGELTAGIAHEIQNPLNFVNNFSEVNKEMLVEMREEIEKKNFEEVGAIAKSVEENEEKIIFHGKRADAIVKSMLQHSRSNSGTKEPTDINALCDEYLRLAFHGLKARDKSFEASFHFEPDETLPKVNVVPQDIGRVLLNLINNAFQACGIADLRMMNADYKPLVTVTTRNLGERVEISVKDNGPGIPENIKDKIFQPSFTTKPTGQGTGLGLSLSYDIVKAHGGELKVETKEARPDDPVGRGEGSTFILQLPTA